METKPHTAPPRPARRWARYAGATAVTIAANAVLLVMLSSWQPAAGEGDDRPMRAVPLEVIDLPEEMELADAPPASPVTPSEPPPATPPMPPLPRPQLTAAAKLELSPLPDPDAIGIPDVPADVPAFTAKAVIVTPAPPAATPGDPNATRGPVLIQPPDLASYYPRRARMRRITGNSTVRVTVGLDGRATAVSVVASTPPGVFDTAAKRVASTFRFRPALRDGRPVAASVPVTLIWRLER